MTIIDIDGLCPCIDGATFRLDYDNSLYTQGFIHNWIIKIPPYFGLKQFSQCSSGVSLVSGGPFSSCIDNAFYIATQGIWYYGPVFYCSVNGTFDLYFSWIKKRFLDNFGVCMGSWDYQWQSMNIGYVAGTAGNCSGTIYREFTISNLYDSPIYGTSGYPYQYMNIFSCSNSGNLKVIITE